MPVAVESRIPEIAAEAETRSQIAVQETCAEVAFGARLNLIRHGSVDTGELLASVRDDADGYEGSVSAGNGLEDARAVYIELGTGVRGSEYEFPGKPDDVAYDMSWMRGIPKNNGNGFAYMIPALEFEREPFEERMSRVYG